MTLDTRTMTYRGGVIGLGWMGMLYDVAQRVGDRDALYDVNDVFRPSPDVEIHRKIHHHQHPGNEGSPTSYADALAERLEVDLVAAADRDSQRLEIFRQRYGEKTVYTDAKEMLRNEHLDIVAIATNVRGRSDLTCLAVDCGAKGIMVEKPMVHTLQEADRMVKTCADAGVPLCGGSVSTIHPSFAKAKEMVKSGVIGDLHSIEAPAPHAQDQQWTFFLESAPAWVIGTGDLPRRESGSDEFAGEGMLVSADGLVVHFRRGVSRLHLMGTEGEIRFSFRPSWWKLWQDLDTVAGRQRVEMPWPGPQMIEPYGGAYVLADVLDCLEGKLDEPKNSGRRVAMAIEVEIALKQSSAQGGMRVDLPLEDRSLGLHYDWFR